MLKTAHAAIAAAALYCLAVMLGALPAHAANVPCGPWEAMLRALYEKHGEVPTYIATTSSGVVLTVTVNPDTGSFTVLSQSNPDVMCMVSSASVRPTIANALVARPQPVAMPEPLLPLVAATGWSGERFFVRPFEIGNVFPQVPGVYIWTRESFDGDWLAIYVGESGDLNDRLTIRLRSHHCYSRALALGATHIAVMKIIGGETVRTRLRRLLRQPPHKPNRVRLLLVGINFASLLDEGSRLGSVIPASQDRLLGRSAVGHR